MSKLARPARTLALAASMIAGIALVVSSAAAQERFTLRKSSDREFDQRVRRADPGKVIATELAFARAAQEKGQWTAFAEFAADDAVMFVPEPINAKEWLRRQTNPAQTVRWQPHEVWSSCDGTLAVTRGAWQRPDGSTGYFTTVWERQRNSEYRWVMDQGDALAQPLPEREMIEARVADCRLESPQTPATDFTDDPSEKINSGHSRDGTLWWRVVTKADGSRRVTATYWDGSAWQVAFMEQVEGR